MKKLKAFDCLSSAYCGFRREALTFVARRRSRSTTPPPPASAAPRGETLATAMIGKRMLLGALAATLVTSCASNSDVSSSDDTALPVEAASAPGESDPALNNDPFLNNGGQSADASALATTPTESPVIPPADAPSAPPPTSPVAEAPPVPVAPQDLPKPMVDGETSPAPAPEQTASASNESSSLPGATADTPPVTSPSGTTAEAAPPGPGADTPPPYTTSTTLDSTTQANNSEPSTATTPSVPPPVVDAPTPAGRRDQRQALKEYQDRQQSLARDDDEIDERANYAHEGGAWQIALEYDLTGVQAPAASITGTVSDTNTAGGAASLTYFPLRGIDSGRLGVGARLGAYLSSYDTVNGSVSNSSSKKLSAITYGLRGSYEFQYWIAQLFVPFVFVGYDQVSTKDFADAKTSVRVAGSKFGSVNYGAGLNFNLNRLEPQSASKSLVSTGIRKFYLSYTFMQRSGDLTGASHFLGLRFEY